MHIGTNNEGTSCLWRHQRYSPNGNPHSYDDLPTSSSPGPMLFHINHNRTLAVSSHRTLPRQVHDNQSLLLLYLDSCNLNVNSSSSPIPPPPLIPNSKPTTPLQPLHFLDILLLRLPRRQFILLHDFDPRLHLGFALQVEHARFLRGGEVRAGAGFVEAVDLVGEDTLAGSSNARARREEKTSEKSNRGGGE